MTYHDIVDIELTFLSSAASMALIRFVVAITITSCPTLFPPVMPSISFSNVDSMRDSTLLELDEASLDGDIMVYHKCPK